jgi:hypothetical protein
MHIIPTLVRLRQGNPELKGSLGYIVRPCFKKQKQRKRNVILYLLSKY